MLLESCISFPLTHDKRLNCFSLLVISSSRVLPTQALFSMIVSSVVISESFSFSSKSSAPEVLGNNHFIKMQKIIPAMTIGKPIFATVKSPREGSPALFKILLDSKNAGAPIKVNVVPREAAVAIGIRSLEACKFFSSLQIFIIIGSIIAVTIK